MGAAGCVPGSRTTQEGAPRWGRGALFRLRSAAADDRCSGAGRLQLENPRRSRRRQRERPRKSRSVCRAGEKGSPSEGGRLEFDCAVLPDFTQKMQPAGKAAGAGKELFLRRKRRRDEEPRLSGIGWRRQEFGEGRRRLRRSGARHERHEKSRRNEEPRADLQTLTERNRDGVLRDRGSPEKALARAPAASPKRAPFSSFSAR